MCHSHATLPSKGRPQAKLGLFVSQTQNKKLSSWGHGCWSDRDGSSVPGTAAPPEHGLLGPVFK